jgi:replicative DNA helicase
MEDIKLPPYDASAEESAIGSLLIDGELISLAKASPDDYYLDQNKYLYEAMKSLNADGVAINQVTVADKLRSMGNMEKVGGIARLSYLISVCPTSVDFEYYEQIVMRMAAHRNLISVGDRLLAVGYEGSEDTGDALALADSLLLGLRQRTSNSHYLTPKERADKMYERYTALYMAPEEVSIKTGLSSVDAKIGGGLFPGKLYIIAARPSMGKTAFLETLSNNISRTRNVLFCTGEMTNDDLSDRDVAGITGMDVDEVTRGRYNEDAYTKITQAIPVLLSRNLYFMEQSRGFRFTTSNIYQTAYEIQSRHGLDAVFIDYLGLIADTKGNNQNERLGFIARELKEMSKIINVPVVAAHQLNREVDRRPYKNADGTPGRYPQMSDLRESGQIEEHADDVYFLYRDNYYNPESPDKTTHLLYAKHRQNGKVAGTMTRLAYVDARQMYGDLSYTPQERMFEDAC